MQHGFDTCIYSQKVISISGLLPSLSICDLIAHFGFVGFNDSADKILKNSLQQRVVKNVKFRFKEKYGIHPIIGMGGIY